MSQQTTTVILPPTLKAAVQAEAKDSGVSMAAVIRWALRDRYLAQAQEAGVMITEQDWVTHQQATEVQQ
ncbi:MAG: hypothetical protein DRN81_06065 [Thermoproteota archaeon]|nr:MAG: hypothetical protein DRN81_06065 [Candidatus Korarchaeota archaeon]